MNSGRVVLEHLRTLKHHRTFIRVVDPLSELSYALNPDDKRDKNVVKTWAADFEAKTGRKSITRKEQLEDGGMAINKGLP